MKSFFKPSCGLNNDEDRTLTDDQIDALLRLADTLSNSISTVTDRRKIPQLVNEALSRLDSSLGTDGADKVRQHVAEHVKRHIVLTRSEK